MMRSSRLDRQLRIEGWNQQALKNAKIGVIGDNDLLASHYIMAASALGINHMLVLAPVLDPILIEIAQKLNIRFTLTHIEGFFTHPVIAELFKGCNFIVDLSRYGLANKLLIEIGFKENIPIIRGSCYEANGEQGLKVFSYLKGREWQELEQVLSPYNLPNSHFDDAVLDIIISGIALEETKNLLMNRHPSDELISYKRKKIPSPCVQPKILG